MLANLSGGAAARGALFLACIDIWSMALCGCRGKTPVMTRLRYIRIETLLPLHPAWKQVAMLQQETTQLAASRPRPDGIVLELPGLPSNFTPPQKVPPNLVEERQRRLKEEAARYVDSYSEQVMARNNAIYQQEEKSARDTMEATYLSELAARKKALQAVADAKVRTLLAEKEKLRYRIVALRSQIAAYTKQARDDAMLQLDRTRADVAMLDKERVDILAAVEQQAIKEMVEERKRLEADLAKRLAERRRQLEQEGKDLTAQELARLSKLPDPIPAIGTTPPPPRYVHETPLPLPTPQQTLQAVQAAQTTVDRETQRRQPEWQAQQVRLIAVIRADTQQAVEQIAREQGWKLAPEGTRGAADATNAVAAAIRTQWRVH